MLLTSLLLLEGVEIPLDTRRHARYHQPMPKLYAYQQFREFPYYKVQWFDEVGLCWRDVQKAHTTSAAAKAAFVPGKQCRIMQVNERGRHPLSVHPA